MKPRILLVAAVALVATLATAAQAQVQILATAGAWEAFGGKSNDGTPVCGIGTSAGDRYFGVKYFGGGDSFELQLGSQDWNVEDEAPLAIQMEFDSRGAWTGTASGFHFRSGMAGLWIAIESNKLADFLSDFRQAGSFRVEFDDAEMRPWFGNLAGTDQLVEVMLRCMRNL